MQDAFDDYQRMADQRERDIHERIDQNQEENHAPRHAPMTITAEAIIAANDERKMKLLTNFTINEFQAVYNVVDQVLKERAHKDALASPQTRFLLTLTWCKYGETYKPMAMKFGLKYTYARQIVTQTISQTQPVLESVYIKWISVPERIGANIPVVDYQFLLGSIDATVQKIYRPARRQRDYYSGKHKMHCIKTQALVNPGGLLIHHSHCVPGAQHDFNLFKNSGIKELISKENETCQRVLNSNCTVLGDSGYQGLTNEIVGGVTPHKKPRNGELSEEEQRENAKIGKNRIIVENWFGRHKILWAICAGTFRQDIRMYEKIWGLCAALTNYHITLHPLRADEYRPWMDRTDEDN